MSWHLVPFVEFWLFLGIGLVWRSWLQARRYGGSGLMLFREGPLQTIRDASVVLFTTFVGWQAGMVAYGAAPLAAAPLRIGGAALAAIGTALMVVAQLDLGASWRVGIERDARPGLVTTGWYAFCRNPIFLFMMVAFVGILLQVPRWQSLLLVLMGYLGLRLQVAREEAYLEESYGEAYAEYARRVGRFVPWVGRLRA
jgi:protein-S-isoprenylcysteine O-methyltransferase Ste14